MAKARRQSNNSVSTVGDVIHSVLSEAQFQSLRGADWVLCDGRSVAGSKLATEFGVSVLPDARGMFIRGKNNGRSDGNQDSAGERTLGSFQNDQLQGHNHQTNASVVPGGGSGAMSPTGGAFIPSDTRAPYSVDGANGTPRIGSETRPKNIALNIFIKIN